MLVDALRIFTDTSSRDYFHIKADLIVWDTDKYDFGDRYDSKDNGKLIEKNWLISSQGTNAESEKGLYAIRSEIGRSPLPTHEIIRLASVLKKIQNKMGKLEKEFGYANDFDTALTFYARCLGVKTFVYRGRDGTYLASDIEMARYKVKDMVKAWQDEHQASSNSNVIRMGT